MPASAATWTFAFDQARQVPGTAALNPAGSYLDVSGASCPAADQCVLLGFMNNDWASVSRAGDRAQHPQDR